MPSKASETSVRSPSFSLQSSELQWAIAEQCWEEATFFFFFPWAKTLLSSCLQAVSWQSVRSNFCLFHPRENRSSPYQSSPRGRYFLQHSLLSYWEEANQGASSLRSLEHHFNNVSHDKVLGLFVFCWLAPSLISSFGTLQYNLQFILLFWEKKKKVQLCHSTEWRFPDGFTLMIFAHCLSAISLLLV